MDDLISRQAAIDACIRVREYRAYDEIEEIKALPSAQLEIIRCRDCKNREDDDCPMRFIEWVKYDDDGYIECIIHDYTKDDGFCDRAERRTDE